MQVIVLMFERQILLVLDYLERRTPNREARRSRLTAGDERRQGSLIDGRR